MGVPAAKLHESPPVVGQAILPADSLSAGPAARRAAWSCNPVGMGVPPAKLHEKPLPDGRGSAGAAPAPVRAATVRERSRSWFFAPGPHTKSLAHPRRFLLNHQGIMPRLIGI